MALLPVMLFSALLHAFVGWRLLGDLALASPALAWATGLVLLASALLMPMGLFARRAARGRFALALTWAGLLCMGLFSTLFVLTVLRDAVLLLAWLASLLWPGGLALDALVATSALAVPLLGLLATVLGFWNARRTAAVVRVDVPIAGLPAALHGFTVAQISDVHIGPTLRHRHMHAIVARVNSLGADMVAITGDLVDGRVHELSDHVAPLAQLQSRHGTYFVTGNHEYYSGADSWLAHLGKLGIKALRNEHVVIGGSDSGFVLAGIDDPTSPLSDLKQALAGRDASRACVLLAHQPKAIELADELGVDLQLSGHTHGGQICLPGGVPITLDSNLPRRFGAGAWCYGEMAGYTSVGAGSSVVAVRLNCPPEITLHRLERDGAQ